MSAFLAQKEQCQRAGPGMCADDIADIQDFLNFGSILLFKHVTKKLGISYTVCLTDKDSVFGGSTLCQLPEPCPC